MSTFAERFWAKVERTSTCWVWTADVAPGGYGRINRDGKASRAHRVSWEMHNGPIPAGLMVCHKCDNPPCVNPDHLFLGTGRDNAQDMGRKGRAPLQVYPELVKRGADIHGSKLDEDTVRSIRAAYALGATRSGLARRHGVSKRSIDFVVERKTWAHVA